MTHKQKRMLFNWLHKQGALHKYKRARYIYSQMKSAPFKSYRQMQFFGAIISGFDWACTLEGSFYWVDIHVAWRKFLQKNDL